MPDDVANTARRVHSEAVVSKLTPRVRMRGVLVVRAARRVNDEL